MIQLSRFDLTASDYLLTVADLAAQRGEVFADAFQLMVAEARAARSTGDDLTLCPPLRPHEATAVDIIARAYEAAVKRKDREAQHRIVVEGLALLARWPSFLLEFSARIRTEAPETWHSATAS